MQNWKTDSKLHSCNRDSNLKKKLDYHKTYVKEFLDSDPLQDWPSFERCKGLWKFCEDNIVEFKKGIRVLDCGTKDGQFPEWLVSQGYDALGIDVSKKYVEYAESKGRPVMYTNVCKMHFYDDIFNVVFSHHILGLTPDYNVALREMFRVISRNGILITLNDCPGNPKKHYHYIRSVDDLRESLNKISMCNILYFDYYKNDKEFLIVLQKDDYEDNCDIRYA